MTSLMESSTLLGLSMSFFDEITASLSPAASSITGKPLIYELIFEFFRDDPEASNRTKLASVLLPMYSMRSSLIEMMP